MMTATVLPDTDPEGRVGLAAAAALLDTPKGLLSRNLGTWAPLLDQPEVVAPSGVTGGSGSRKYWSPRDVVVMAMMLATMDTAGQPTLCTAGRAALARAIYDAPWGWTVIRIEVDDLGITYRPRWDLGERAANA